MRDFRVRRAAMSAAANHGGTHGGRRTRRGRVFVIDDDCAVRRALDRFLTAAGYEVHGFGNPALFLDIVPKTPACLILDVRMPHMTGLELQQEISGSKRDVPIVFITGHSAAELGLQTHDNHTIDVLEKPLDGAQLLAAVERALACSRAVHSHQA